MDNLRRIDEIPQPYRNVFTEYPCFNAVQSGVLDDVLFTDKSVVVSGPTGSGKTAIFELAVIRLLIQCKNIGISQKIKVIYISPIKALCHERLLDWHKKFSPFGLNCIAATGDSDKLDFQHLANHNLIISTPEKWDSLTRKWRDHEKIVNVIKLFMIDEVHLLNEENRGSTLEVIVCRMKTVENSVDCSGDEYDIFNQKVRFIALSATVANIEDIAQWIDKPSQVKCYKFSEEMRPVKLKKLVYGYNCNPKTMSPFKFDLSLNYRLPSLMTQYSDGKPTLIFCNTRRSVEMTANHLLHSLRIQLGDEQTRKLREVADLITDVKAKATIRHGIGYHHAGMIPETRRAIEELFRSGQLPVLATTSTLAMGVNLPAHLVIVKSTKCYDAGGFRDYTETAVLQMIGRAGRPQFDVSATALILTTNEDKPKFERMVSCEQPIESNLHRHLTEHLNAEIVLRTITSLDVAMRWLSTTFLYVRARKNPHHYGINVGYTQAQIDKRLLEMCQIDLNKLMSSGMITIDQDIVITPSSTGKIMAKYYVAFETMKLFTQISGTEILMQILALVSKCQEFASMRLRVSDKSTLNLLNKNPRKDAVRFPLNGRIKSRDMKINCIIQAVLGNLDIADHSILSESLTIMRNGERITRCLIEYLETRGGDCYAALLNSLVLAKCFSAKLWEDSPYVSKQLTGIGSVMSNQLGKAGKTTFRKIVESNPRDLELIIKRKPPMGNNLVDEAERIPRYGMILERSACGRKLEVRVTLENADNVREQSTVNVRSTMILLVGNSSNRILAYEKYEHSYMIQQTTIMKTVEVDPNSETVTAHFISDDWVGFDCNASVTIGTDNNRKSNEKNAKKTSRTEEGSTYIQTFLDMYMKTTKKAGENRVVGKKGTSVKVRKMNEPIPPTSAEIKKPGKVGDDHETMQGEKGSKDLQFSAPSSRNDDVTVKGNEPATVEVLEIEESTPKDAIGNSQTSLFSGKRNGKEDQGPEKHPYEDEQYLDCNMVIGETERSSEKLERENDLEEMDCIAHIKDKMAEEPSLSYISKKYGMENLEHDETDKKHTEHASNDIEQMEEEEEEEKSTEIVNFVSEPDRKRQSLDDFKFPNKKKLSHDIPANDLPNSTGDRRFYAITDILEPRAKLMGTRPQSDISKERSRDNVQKSLTWRSPLVFSPLVRRSPAFSNVPNVETEPRFDPNNETLETSASSVSVQRTSRGRDVPRQTDKMRPTHFPLRDKEYEETSGDEQVREPYDICSRSFLEMFGLSDNRYKSAPRWKERKTSPIVDYYSQLMTQPIHVQKPKTPRGRDEIMKDEHVVPKPENTFQRAFEPPQQRFRPDKEKEATGFHKNRPILSQNDPFPYSQVDRTPRVESNATYVPGSVTRLPKREIDDNAHVPNYPRQGSFPNSLPTNQNFTREDYVPTSSCPAPYDYPKVPSRCQCCRNSCCTAYGDVENVPPYLNPYEDFHGQPTYSRYFQRNRTNANNFLYPRAYEPTDYGDGEILNEKYPDTVPFQDFNGRDVPQGTPLRLERKPDGGTSQSSFLAPDTQRRYGDENDARNRLSWAYRGEHPRAPRSQYQFRDNSEGSCFGDDVPVLTRISPTSTQTCSQRNVFRPREFCGNVAFQDHDFEHESESFAVPRARHYPDQMFGFPPVYEEMETLPRPTNDKEYVMNKFLYSLNRE